MAETGTLTRIATHFTNAILPLGDIASDPALFKSYLYRLGWRVESLPPEYSALANDVSDLKARLESLIEDESPANVAAIIESIIRLIQSVQSINTVPPEIGTLDRDAFLENLKSIFFDLFLTDYLLADFPEVFNLSRLLGVI